jgi:class 3 adenylate cyclase
MATLEQRTDDIRAVMDAVGIERAHLFGGSEGGSMASMFAAMHPERVQSLIIWGAQAKWINTPDHPWGQTLEEHQAMLDMIHDGWPTVEYVVGPGAGLGPDAEPAIVENLLRYMRAAASPSAVRAYEAMNADIDTRSILPAINAPTMVMNRTGDPVAIVDAARDMAKRIPGAVFKEYAGNSHSIALDDMDVILSDIQEFITGERPAESADRVLATVMFVDIAASTERAAQLGDAAWRSLLNAYYAIVRKALARHRGREANAAGDGFLATFDGPARAVRCALEIAQAVRELGVDVRAGVHIGESEMMGDNIGGLAVHIGARVMSEAAPGEVLTSSTVKDLVAGSGLSFSDRGARALKGVPCEWRLFAAS